MTEKKKIGRPPRSENGPSSVNLTMRLQTSIYEAIRADADQFGRSISAQAERRLMYREPGINDVGRMVELVIAAVEMRAGKSWDQDEQTRRQCRLAADFVLTGVLGSPLKPGDEEHDELLKVADGIFGAVAVASHSDEELFGDVMSESSACQRGHGGSRKPAAKAARKK